MALSEAERQEVILDRGRAARLADFLRSEFWVKDFAPYLKAEELKCKEMALWNPTSCKADIEAIALQSAFNGGMLRALEKMRIDFGVWQAKGEDAVKILDKDAEQKKGGSSK